MSEISAKASDLFACFCSAFIADYESNEVLRSEEQYERYIAKVQDLKEAERNLVDYIAELETENAALKEERRWIPVSERLPELERDVLAIVEDCVAIGHFYEDGGRVYFSWDKFIGMPVATHWMPLPEPPEVK